MQKFGQKLRTLRTQRGLSMKELATMLGYSAVGYISELEMGKKVPTIKLVLGVSRLFNISTDKLLKDELDLDDEIKERLDG